MSITVSHLEVHTPDGQAVLHDFDATLEPGQITLIVGRPGAGKSTLLNALAGLVPTGPGCITIDGEPMWRTPRRFNRNAIMNIGIVFQSPEYQLFATTVQKEFDYSLRPIRLDGGTRSARTARALARMGMSTDMLPKSPFRLSGGQKRRIALSTTISTRPRWLLLDEPTSGLDPEGVHDLMQWIVSERDDNRGVIIATHDLDELLPIADHILFVHGGNVVASLSTREILDHAYLFDFVGIGPPACISIAQTLRQFGIAGSPERLDADSLAESIAAHVSSRRSAERSAEGAERGAEQGAENGVEHGVENGADQRAEHGTEQGVKPVSPDSSAQPVSRESAAQPTKEATAENVRDRENQQTPAWRISRGRVLQMIDPRIKWGLYLFLSVVIASQSNLVGVGLATITLAILWYLGKPLFTSLPQVLKPLWAMLAISVIFAGLQLAPTRGSFWNFGPLYFSFSSASVTLFQMWKWILVMVSGILFVRTTSPLQLKQGLAWFLSMLRPLRFPVNVVTLAASLVLRFIPVFMAELERFAKIVQARGKKFTRPGRIGWRDVPPLVTPMLVSLLQWGESFTVALQAKGYREISDYPNRPSMFPPLTRIDKWVLGVGGGWLIILLSTVWISV